MKKMCGKLGPFFCALLLTAAITAFFHWDSWAKKLYLFDDLVGGGTRAVDSVDGDDLTEGDFAIVGVGGQMYLYRLDATSGAAESSPDIIAPDTDPGNKRWELQGIYADMAEFRLRFLTVTKTDDYVLTVADLGKTFIMDSALDKTFSLPSVGSDEDGYIVTVIKANTGKVTIDAADTDTIRDSGAGGTLYNADAACTWATITLMYNHSKTKWVVVYSDETWIST